MPTDSGDRIAVRDIAPGEALTNDYANLSMHDGETFPSACGTPDCRDQLAWAFCRWHCVPHAAALRLAFLCLHAGEPISLESDSGAGGPRLLPTDLRRCVEGAASDKREDLTLAQAKIREPRPMKAITALLLCPILVGCATFEDAKPKEPLSAVTVYREPSSLDSIFPMLFAVDGRPVAQLQPNQEIRFEVAAGDHRFQYELGVYDCSANVRLESGKTYLYRLAQGCIIEPEHQP